MDDLKACIESSQLVGLVLQPEQYGPAPNLATAWDGRPAPIELWVNCLATTALDTELHVSNRRNWMANCHVSSHGSW